MTPAYPRDLIGYGRVPPDPKWPGGARIAVQFVLNYEEGAENSILHGDPASEAFLSDIAGAAPIPGARNMNMESMYEYGSRAGFWRVHRAFTERQMPLTVYGVAMALERNPAAVAAMQEADWEIASHGYRWIDYQHMPEAEERAHTRQALAIHERTTGRKPDGWYTGRTSPNTRRIVLEEHPGLVYSSDSYADDLPYWVSEGGKPHLVVPYTLDVNDYRTVAGTYLPTSEELFAYWRDSFDLLYAEGASQPKMLNIGLHCRLVGRPGRAVALIRFLDHVLGHDKVWVCRRVDLARHWQKVHPPKP
ncbi:allantoinase PuuE [Desertibaculum subflavum]|uniref:allantoinase PuuE n=1 Tax=Desertibaculum subflavum TaxID=2268458 RepID=UPI000E663715